MAKLWVVGGIVAFIVLAEALAGSSGTVSSIGATNTLIIILASTFALIVSIILWIATQVYKISAEVATVRQDLKDLRDRVMQK